MIKTFIILFIIQTLSAKTIGPPGVIESITEIAGIQLRRYERLMDEIKLNPQILSSIEELKDVRLDPIFLQSVILYSENSYINAIDGDECRFLSFLSNGLLYDNSGVVTSVAIRYKNTDQKEYSALVSVEDYLNYSTRNKCKLQKEYDRLFLSENVETTLKSIGISIPQNQNQCRSVYKELRESKYLGQICGVMKKITKAKEAAKRNVNDNELSLQRRNTAEIISGRVFARQVTTLQYDFYSHFCQNMTNERHFCEKYSSSSFWKQDVNSAKMHPTFIALCEREFKKSKLTKDEFIECSNKLSVQNNWCHFSLSKFEAFYPSPTCRDIGDALKKSNLNVKVSDCPAKIDNEGIVNSGRVLHHFIDKAPSDTNCSTSLSSTFLKINKDNENDEIWNNKICYQDPIRDGKTCYHAVMNQDSDSEFAETTIIEKILKRTKNLSSNSKCEFVEKNKYQPVRLKFKTGCFIIYDENQCTSKRCDKKIVYNDEEVRGIEYQNNIFFDYLPISNLSMKKSFIGLTENVTSNKRKPIENYTELKAYFSTSKNKIAHGVVCTEDLYPQIFESLYFKQCSPLPIIIDGHYEEGATGYVILRSAIDNVHAPRFIKWHTLYTSLKNYQDIQPLGLWPLYGTK